MLSTKVKEQDDRIDEAFDLVRKEIERFRLDLLDKIDREVSIAIELKSNLSNSMGLS